MTNQVQQQMDELLINQLALYDEYHLLQEQLCKNMKMVKNFFYLIEIPTDVKCYLL